MKFNIPEPIEYEANFTDTVFTNDAAADNAW
jgi:hypothetical protein